MNRTLQFDKVLDKILNNLSPETRSCKSCGGKFQIFQEDIEMYRKLRVPPPMLCPSCRLQRRLVLMLRLPPFYRRSCHVPGHTEKVISLYPESSPHVVYDNKYWRSDHWDQLDYGRKYDRMRSFFDQFRELFFSIPHQALFVDTQSVNSDYSIAGASGKNCYYVSSPIFAENILYGMLPFSSKDCVDILKIYNSELLYECVNCRESFNCNFCIDSEKCRDSWFLSECRNCSNCFMSSNLRNKSYYFRNEQLSKEAYEERMRSLNLKSRKELNKYRKEFEDLQQNSIHRAVRTKNAINSVGNNIFDCINCFYAFDAYENCENLRYITSSLGAKDSEDVYGIEHSSLCYESAGSSGNSYLFSANLRNCSFIEYSQYCRDSDYCFGCVGLRSKKFCIFNIQYTEEEYWKTVDEIKLRMLEQGEYGELYPITFGLMPYQNTTAQKEFPLTKEEARAGGIPWYEHPASDLPPGIKIHEYTDLPDSIEEVSDKILKEAVYCEATNKPFRFIKPELEFYRKKGLPLPTRHPDRRMRELFNLDTPFRLWQHSCSKCGKETNSVYDPKKKLTVYCEYCYLNTFA